MRAVRLARDPKRMEEPGNFRRSYVRSQLARLDQVWWIVDKCLSCQTIKNLVGAGDGIAFVDDADI